MWRKLPNAKNALLFALAFCCVLLLVSQGGTRTQPVQEAGSFAGDVELAHFRIKSLSSRSQELKRSIAEMRAFLAQNAKKVGHLDPTAATLSGKLGALGNDLLDNQQRGFKNSKADAVVGVRAVQPQQQLEPVKQQAVVAAGGGGNAAGGLDTLLHQSSQKVLDTVAGLDHVSSMAALNPIRKTSQGRSGVRLVVGIPTVHRSKQSYLLATVQSLISNLAMFDPTDILFVVMVADTDKDKVDFVFSEMSSKLSENIQSGMVDVIAPPPALYPDLKSMKPSFDDPKDRATWRVKQVFDFAYLMMYARSRGMYYLQVEDDIQAMPNYATHIVERAKKDNTWDVLEFSSLGFIGKLFRSNDLTEMAHFFLANAPYKPVDWLLDDWFYVRYCHPEKDYKDCRNRKKAHRVLFKPSLFQHVGQYSSLDGKIQKLKDKSFKQENLPSLHTNPAAVISSSIKHFQQNTIEAAYLGTGFFWGMGQSRDDRITVTFGSPTILKRILIASGNTDHPGDSFASSVKLQYLTQEENSKNPTSPSWQDLCTPDTKGTFDCKLKADIKELKAISILFAEDSKQWILVPGVYLHV
eukprot:scpid57003/ scgid4946/ Alpha-1,3-mannosyl-glycoprotein 4-beta-N-acetylglucosaminyltransferase B; N-glycosyl-oligosaccharide-glycoprotein N-acetylglucosaminyltransferase IVb; UDP-N-acetylglucosamine: alpha-1,3-D-mannoside beta-1,4-N-acetylglucosaminyltransferase IVb